ncbi:TlpA disulfide reductase family protein [Halopseudomonas bauzanensis]|uniref:TlpA family protein disulfide reductase n=1 Tax=Halopseudomonas bauzanensis TaxID=653930 RepID=A0A4V5NKY9_9GAMM|nr:TlpA disulfide reductase family protein [Halopseudomonas bauzanensis]TKA93607.1 TlpA family protein disulfide reductase [Halopseudomonas bauzanensis]
MNLFVPIGPFSLPLNALLVMIAAVLGSWIAARHAKRLGISSEGAVWLALASGLVVARLGFVFNYANVYLAEPLSLLDIRDGGWNAWWGLAAVWACTLLIIHRRPALRQPMLKGISTFSLILLLSIALDALPTSANRPLPNLPVTALNGDSVRLPDFAGKPTVINLWASWCPPCRREMPVFEQAQAEREDMHFVFLNQGEDGATVQDFLRDTGLVLDNVLLDRMADMGQSLGQRGLPVTLFFNAEGNLEDIRLGELSRGSLAQRLDALIPELLSEEK